MIFSAASEAVIGDFVIVPDYDPRRDGVGGLKFGFAFVLGVAGAVVLEADALHLWRWNAPQLGADVAAITGQAVLIDVVAEMNDRIEVFVARQRLVSVEETMR